MLKTIAPVFSRESFFLDEKKKTIKSVVPERERKKERKSKYGGMVMAAYNHIQVTFRDFFLSWIETTCNMLYPRFLNLLLPSILSFLKNHHHSFNDVFPFITFLSVGKRKI